MKMGPILGILLAIFLHAGFLLFGGLLIPKAKEDQGTLQQVELLSESDTADEKQPEPEPDTEPKEELEAEAEEVPDAAEVIRNLELTSAATPKLEAASLSAIEDALRGQLGDGMGFGDAMGFSSGGSISGTGAPGGPGETLADAFDLADIDQDPRVMFQNSPMMPNEMRGKKVEGVVTVIFVVDASGKVTDPRVEKSSHPAFDKPALDAVRQWRFEAGVKSGERVPCKMRITIRFPVS